MWIFIDDEVANNPLHCGHTARFILPTWVIAWYSNEHLVANAFKQPCLSHLYGLSPVCVLSCLSRSAFFLNAFLQNWHTFGWGFCTLIFKILVNNNYF